MFEDRSYNRTFFSAPQSVTSLVAAFLEPSLTVLIFLLVTVGFGEPVLRSDLTLCLLVFALTFPGRNRFKDKLLNAGTDIVSSWISLLAILALGGYATNSLHYFENKVLLTWALATPALAQGHGKGQGQAQPMPAPAPPPHGSVSVSVTIGATDQGVIRQYYGQQATQGFCPPGLAKKNNGCMPPGQAKKWAVGQPLPVGVAYYALPPALLGRLTPAPAGYLYVQVGSDVLLMGSATRLIVSAVAIF